MNYTTAKDMNTVHMTVYIRLYVQVNRHKQSWNSAVFIIVVMC